MILFISAFVLGFAIGFVSDLCIRRSDCRDCVCKDVYEFETGLKFNS